jgi:hypothetical protein
MQDRNGGKARKARQHGRRWIRSRWAAPGRWRMDVQAVRHESMQVSDACVERALCGRIAVGSCTSGGRGRGDDGLAAGARSIPPG